MSETEKLQSLHQRSVNGEVLTEQERIALQSWYDKLDREEDLEINKSKPVQNVEELRRNLKEISDQTEAVSRDVKILISQNENLRKENQSLKASFEAQLVENAA